MNRRTFLRGAGVLGVGSTAGCLDWVPTVGETTIGWFAVYNFHGESHKFDVRIERGGTIVHESSHHLDAHDSDDDSRPPRGVVSCTWDADVGDYTVFVRPDQQQWNRFSVMDGVVDPPDCVIAHALFGWSNPDSPTLTFEIDETDCSEVQSLPGGCPDVQ